MPCSSLQPKTPQGGLHASLTLSSAQGSWAKGRRLSQAGQQGFLQEGPGEILVE